MWGRLFLSEAHVLYCVSAGLLNRVESCVLAPKASLVWGGGGVSSLLAESGLLCGPNRTRGSLRMNQTSLFPSGLNAQETESELQGSLRAWSRSFLARDLCVLQQVRLPCSFQFKQASSTPFPGIVLRSK